MEYEVRDLIEAYEIVADCAGSDEPDFEIHLIYYESNYEEYPLEYKQDKYKVFIKHKGGILRLKELVIKPYLFYYDAIFELRHINNKPSAFLNNSKVDIDWYVYDEEINNREDSYDR